MKRIITSMLALFCMASIASAQENESKENKENKDASTITFATLEHDFGKLDYKGDATYDFEFTNTGKSPLILTSVSASCGCTTPEWSKEPILPGKKGAIKVTYDSKRIGVFTKMVYVYSNSPQKMVTLKIAGEILSPQQ